MSNNTGTDVASLRNLAVSLAKDAIFGKEEMSRKSLSGRKNTGVLDPEKLSYIKTLVHSRSKTSRVEFASVWDLCQASISKSSFNF